MAGGSLLTLIDDIATLLDDVSVMSKVAVKKTAGVLGDDLALNAEQVSGVKPDRELPVVWAVAVGSLKNKAILVPAALLISYFVPWLITPLLMIGGAYLCYEGFEKVFHKFFHSPKADTEEIQRRAARLQAVAQPGVDVVAMEKERISGAIRTDFILSAEIIVISLGTVSDSPFGMQVAVLIAVAIVITVGVYGLVAAIVKMDDLGLLLLRRGTPDDPDSQGGSRWKRFIGSGIVAITPLLMRGLGVAGTVAMFLVGGGIVLHGITPLYDALHHVEESLAEISAIAAWVIPILADGLMGVVVGGLLVAGHAAIKSLIGGKSPQAH
jgi:predicted DNA repair protein MutK